jgi:hypothetical protein
VSSGFIIDIVVYIIRIHLVATIDMAVLNLDITIGIVVSRRRIHLVRACFFSFKQYFKKLLLDQGSDVGGSMTRVPRSSKFNPLLFFGSPEVDVSIIGQHSWTGNVRNRSL